MIKAKPLPTHITIAKAAKVLGVSRPTVNAMAMREQIKTEQIAERWVVVVASLPAQARKLLASPQTERK